MKEYENYNFDENSKDNKFLLLWKKVSKYNLGAIFFLIFFAYPVTLEIKNIFFSNLKFNNIYNFIFIIIVIVFLFSIVQKIVILRKKERKTEQKMGIVSIANQEKKGFNGMNIYYLFLALIWIGFLVAPKGMNRLLSLPQENNWIMTVFIFSIGYLMFYALEKEKNLKKGINKKVEIFSWKRLLFTILLYLFLIILPIISYFFIENFIGGHL